MKHFALLILLLAGLPSAVADDVVLNVRRQTETAEDSGRFHRQTSAVTWKAEQTAVVVCDMWDKHWCPESTARVGELAPVMNRVIRKAREKGMLIIHCPSSCMDFYQDTPQRKLAQAAPAVKTKVPLQTWCHLDESIEGSLPIDDTDGGCESPVKSYRAWTRQHPAIEISDGDAITDSAEAFYLMKQKGITNVIVMGVHTNMCVLGRPFSIRQMVQQGQNVVLMRDMTDTMYNPKMRPKVSHFTGTDLIIDHIERNWCPTVLSTDFIGGNEFRFRGDTRKHVAILCAEREYRTNESLPKFAAEQLGTNYRVSFVWDNVGDRNDLPGINVVDQADVLLVSVRRRTLPATQLATVRSFVAAGKPLIGIRTASHAFCQRNKPAPEGLADWPEFDQQVFGGNYTNHHPSGPITQVGRTSDRPHPILSGVGPFSSTGSLYKVSPLADSATQLLSGSIPDADAEPVAWLNSRADGGLSFYTSLGHIKDFDQPGFVRMLKNAVDYLTSQP